MVKAQMIECLPNVHKAWNTFVIPALEVGDRRIILDYTVIQGQPGILSKNLIINKKDTHLGRIGNRVYSGSHRHTWNFLECARILLKT